MLAAVTGQHLPNTLCQRATLDTKAHTLRFAASQMLVSAALSSSSVLGWAWGTTGWGITDRHQIPTRAPSYVGSHSRVPTFRLAPIRIAIARPAICARPCSAAAENTLDVCSGAALNQDYLPAGSDIDLTRFIFDRFSSLVHPPAQRAMTTLARAEAALAQALQQTLVVPVSVPPSRPCAGGQAVQVCDRAFVQGAVQQASRACCQTLSVRSFRNMRSA